MKESIRYNSLTKDIIEAMSQVDNKSQIGTITNFFDSVDEKYTYSPSEKCYYINSFFPSFPSLAWSRMVETFTNITQNNWRLPAQADLVVTGRCHCNCWHCFRAKHNNEDLDLETIRSCLNQLYEMGTSTIGITGGEPMLRDDIVDIIMSIPDGIQGQLYTTGHLIDDNFAKILKKSNITRCIISLDHYDKKVTCEMRHYEKAFDEALNAIKALNRSNIYTSVTVCITDKLLEKEALSNYFEFVKSLAVSEIRIVMPIPQGKLEGKDFSRLYSDAVRYIKQFKKENAMNVNTPAVVNFCELESGNYLGCSAGAHYISINNDGNVTPCVALPLSFGNVKNEPIKTIFDNMGEYFPHSGRVCFGKISGRVLKSDNIDTAITPLPIDVSKKVAAKCWISNERAAFFKCLSDESTKQELKNNA